MSTTTSDDAIRVYWQPGCTSCLRTKEYLTRHGVAFESRNVLADEAAFAELARFKLRQVPIVTRGDKWANGQVLADVAALVGIDEREAGMLPVAEQRARLERVLEATGRYLRQLPDAELETLLPNRPRSHADLVYHIYNIADAFLEEKEGIALTFDSYNRIPTREGASKAALLAYGDEVRSRITGWFNGPGKATDWNARADVYYGEQSQHQFLERTLWHSGQHMRQLMWVLERNGIAPERPLGEETFGGLPMPQKVWDDEVIA